MGDASLRAAVARPVLSHRLVELACAHRVGARAEPAATPEPLVAERPGRHPAHRQRTARARTRDLRAARRRARAPTRSQRARVDLAEPGASTAASAWHAAIGCRCRAWR